MAHERQQACHAAGARPHELGMFFAQQAIQKHLKAQLNRGPLIAGLRANARHVGLDCVRGNAQLTRDLRLAQTGH